MYDIGSPIYIDDDIDCAVINIGAGITAKDGNDR